MIPKLREVLVHLARQREGKVLWIPVKEYYAIVVSPGSNRVLA